MELEKVFLTLGVTAFAVYLYWLGRTVFDMAISVGQIKNELIGNGKETANNATEINRLRSWRHEISQTIQAHELRLDGHDAILDRLDGVKQ